MGVCNSKIGHMTPTTPLSGGQFVINRVEHAMINLSNKFEVPILTHYGNMKGVVKCKKWGGLGSTRVIDYVTIRQRITTSYSSFVETTL